MKIRSFLKQLWSDERGFIGTAAAIVTGVGMAVSVGSKIAGAVISGNQAKDAASKAEEMARPSAQEIMQLESGIRQQDEIIARERKMIEAVDPAILEAGKQAHELLQGKEAAVLDPLKRQRERQKGQLRERLRSQLGPGFETSSAGIEAMGRFDTETGDLLMGHQQQVVGQLLGVAQNASGQSRQTEANAIRGKGGFMDMIANNRMNSAKMSYQSGMAQANATKGMFDAFGSAGDTISAVGGFMGKQGGFGSGNVDGGAAAPRYQSQGNTSWSEPAKNRNVEESSSS